MSSNPKIIVLKTREILYTIILIFLVILLILCLYLMFSGKKNATSSENAATESLLSSESETLKTYTPGIYTSSITLGDSTANVEITVDSNHINGIRLVNLSEAAAASYPLLTPSLSHITSQILETQSIENITAPTENRYTSQLLLSAISDALTIAQK